MLLRGDRASPTCSIRGRAVRCARSRAARRWPRRWASTPSASRSPRSCSRRCSRASRAGCSRTSSAPSTRRPFGLNMGIEYLFMAVVGGVGHVWGALVGASVGADPGRTSCRSCCRSCWAPAATTRSSSSACCWCWCCSTRATASGPFVEARLPRMQPQGRLGRCAGAAPTRPRPPHGERGARRAARCARSSAAWSRSTTSASRSAAGEILGLIGPNGAGKSTTFNLVTGVLPATRGEVRLLGERIDALPSREIARARRRAHLPAREDDRRA